MWITSSNLMNFNLMASENMNKQQIGYDEELDHNLQRVMLCIFTTLKSTQSTLYLIHITEDIKDFWG